jgi:malonyl CoA-acyl carrier protein transacylase
MNSNSIISLQVANSTTIAAHTRVKVSTSGYADVAGAADEAIGHVLQDVDSTVPGRNICDVQLKNAGIHYAIYGTATACSAGDPIVAAADGKVTKGAVSPIGNALESASAAGDIIRVVYY